MSVFIVIVRVARIHLRSHFFLKFYLTERDGLALRGVGGEGKGYPATMIKSSKGPFAFF